MKMGFVENLKPVYLNMDFHIYWFRVFYKTHFPKMGFVVEEVTLEEFSSWIVFFAMSGR